MTNLAITQTLRDPTLKTLPLLVILNHFLLKTFATTYLVPILAQSPPSTGILVLWNLPTTPTCQSAGRPRVRQKPDSAFVRDPTTALIPPDTACQRPPLPIPLLWWSLLYYKDRRILIVLDVRPLARASNNLK
jgi:hypothetical protein